MPSKPISLPMIRETDPARVLHPSLDERPSEVATVAGAGIWLLDRGMKILWMNDVMEGIYGPLSKKADRHCFHVFRKQRRPCRNCLASEAFRSGRIVTGFLSRVTPDGVSRVYQVIETPLTDDRNEVSKVLEIVLDVTEKARLEKTLRNSETEYRTLFEHAGTALALTDPSGKILRSNPEFEKLSGYSRSETENRISFEIFIHPRDRAQWSESGSVFEFVFLNRWGLERLVHARRVRLPGSDRVLFSLTDLTEKRDLRKEIAGKDRFLANILLHSAEAIVAIDPSGVIRSWNRGAELIFGYKPSEILGHPFSTLLARPPSQRGRRKSLPSPFPAEGFVRNVPIEVVTRDGSFRSVSMTRTSVLGPEGEDLGSSAILRDVTEQRRMEQRMVAQERMSALGELAAALAHEIRNPLNSMVITTEVVRGRLRELTAAHRATLERYLEVISSEIRRLDKVVERVLTYAKPIEGKFERVALKPILVHVADLLSVTAKSQRIRLRLHVDDDLPSIEGVSDHLIQILVNLVLNALQATPRGGTVTLVGKRGEFNTVVLSVADTGIGIPKANYRKIFDLHFSTKKKGSGLGLPLVKRLVTAHSGTLTFTSRVRHGTTFTLTFPQS